MDLRMSVSNCGGKEMLGKLLLRDDESEDTRYKLQGLTAVTS